MTLKPGTFVVQYLNSSHRYGVIFEKNKVDEDTGWAFFDVTWASGESSVERADQIKPCKDINDCIEDLVALRKYCK